jgi:hypothetical protein
MGGVSGREYAYIECMTPERFKKMFFTIGDHAGSPLPTSGGIINEEATIRLPGGRLMCAVSYRGDMEGWRRMASEWCKDQMIMFGVVQGQVIVLSNGEEFALTDCELVSC